MGVAQWPSPLTHGTCLMTHRTCLMPHLTCLGRLVRYLYLAHWQLHRNADAHGAVSEYVHGTVSEYVLVIFSLCVLPAARVS